MDNKTWDISKLANFFDRKIVEKVRKIRIPTKDKIDAPRWIINEKGKFSVKSLYNHTNSNGNAETK